MFCTQCGVELEDKDRFCSACGRPTGVGQPAAMLPVQPRRLARDMENKKVAGVCSGFARYLETDVTLIRVLTLMLAFATGIGFIAYFVAWLAMPKEWPSAAANPQFARQGA